MVALGPLAQERVNLVDEDDRWLCLARETEQARDELVRLAIPLVREYRRGDVDKGRAGFLCEGLCEHGLAASGRSEEEDTLWCTEEGGRGGKEVGVKEGVDYGLSERGDD